VREKPGANMIVELNDQAVDGLIKSLLVQDYKSLCSDIDNLESAQELKDYQKEDLEHNYRYRAAMETLLEYYVGFDWKNEL
jgi:hypothetical protein